MDAMAEDGRVTDTVMGHLTNGEIVIPLAISTNERAFEQLALMFELSGMDIREFIVGHQRNKINPETGHPEFWGWKSIVNAVTQPVKTAVDIGKDVVKTTTNVTKDVVNTAVNVTKDVTNTAVNVVKTGVNTATNVAKDVVNLDPVAAVKDVASGAGTAVSQVASGAGSVVSDVGSGVEAVVKDTAAGAKQALKDAYTGVMKETANIMDVLGILPRVPEVNSPSDSSPSTVTQGDASANQRQQAVTDVQAAAGGGASSLTPRTVSGPDNDYKLNKSAVLGL